jgi:phosphoglycolate phosphatase-like HAD superfamily hydrolase
MTALIGIDLDGTIEDSRNDMAAVASRVRASFGLPERAHSELCQHVNAGMDQLYRACFDDYLAGDVGGARYADVRERYEADYLANVAVETRLYPGMSDALPALARFGALVCVTNKPERISRRLLDVLGVGSCFRSVVGGDSCAEIKPHPLLLETAAMRCGFKAQHRPALMIGDTAGDVQLGRAYGARTLWCAWGYVAQTSEKADMNAYDPSELPELVARALISCGNKAC